MKSKKLLNSLYQPGTRIAERYQVVETLGIGGMGTVVRASDEELGNEIVCLKILHPHLLSDETALSRFQQEISISRQLSHPNIVRVFDIEQVNNNSLCFISMEWIDGLSLAEYLRLHKGSRLTWQNALKILEQVAQALLHAHRKDILHRDLKPSNILLNSHGIAKLSDFGIAQSLQVTQGLTATGESLGTPQYMSPEHFSGKKQNPRSDIYSLGIIAYEMLVGRPPYIDDNFVVLAQKHLSEELPKKALLELAPPKWYVEFIEKCCAKNQIDRFADAAELLRFLRENGSDTLQQTRLRITSRNISKPFFEGFFSVAQIRFIHTLFPLIFVTITLAAVVQTSSRIKILEEILNVEKTFQLKLAGLKNTLGFPTVVPEDTEGIIDAIEDGHTTFIAPIISKKMDINQADEDGNTLLHHAVLAEDFYITRALLDHPHIRKNLRNKRGETPLALAVKSSQLRIAGLLLSYRANPNIPDNKGNTCLHLAAIYKNTSMVEEITKRKEYLIDSWKTNKAGNTPLHIAVRNEDIDSVAIMLKGGVNPNLRDSFGHTPLMIAARVEGGNMKKMLTLLVSYGASFRAVDNKGFSVHHYAKTKRSKQVLKRLYKKRGF